MRLFAYYVFHSVLNTLKKLLKTWVAVFLVLCVAGGLLGGIIGTVISFVEDQNEAKVESVEEEDEDDADDADEDDDDIGFSFTADIEKYMKEYDLTPANIVDFCISAVFFLILATNVSNAQNSGKIFLPADVPMMFASPLKPQSVLLFRLTCTLGSSFFVSLFMIFQMPNLMVNAGLGFWGALSCIVVYMLILMFSTLIQVTFYTIASKLDNATDKFHKILIGFYGVLAAGFAAYVMLGGKELIPAVKDYFANPATHWVPFWGWLRGISYNAVNGDLAMSGIYLGLFAVSCILMIVFIWKMKADFYEDAMFAAERKAEQIENAQRASSGATVVREKERKGSIDREGFRFGCGANVFFYKAVFNRFRFAKLKIFSTTMLVYLVMGVFASFFAGRYAPDTIDKFMIPACAMGIIAFYRTLGDPIREDTSREFFILIPDKPYSKIIWSLLGCLTVTAIDLAIPMVISGIMLQANPLVILMWFVFILSISFFATVVGTFISLAVPTEGAQTIKFVLQMIFLYFGLGPSAAVVFAGVYFNVLVPALLIGTLMNAVTGFLVSLLLPVFLGRK